MHIPIKLSANKNNNISLKKSKKLSQNTWLKTKEWKIVLKIDIKSMLKKAVFFLFSYTMDLWKRNGFMLKQSETSFGLRGAEIKYQIKN